MVGSKRDFLKTTAIGIFSVAMMGSVSAQTPISTGEGIIGELKPLCRKTVAEEARQHELKLIEQLEKSGVKISSEQKEMLLKNAVEDAISVLSAQYRFVD